MFGSEKVSGSVNRKRPTPILASVCACNPPTPPQPAIETSDAASFCCSSREINPRLRSNASAEWNGAIGLSPEGWAMHFGDRQGCRCKLVRWSCAEHSVHLGGFERHFPVTEHNVVNV